MLGASAGHSSGSSAHSACSAQFVLASPFERWHVAVPCYQVPFHSAAFPSWLPVARHVVRQSRLGASASADPYVVQDSEPWSGGREEDLGGHPHQASADMPPSSCCCIRIKVRTYATH